MAYRINQGDFQARFDSLGRLTHLGHPDHIKDQPTCFSLSNPVREGYWTVNCGNQDIFFDPEITQRDFDYEAGTLTLSSPFRGPGEWWGLDMKRTYRLEHGLLRCDFALTNWIPPMKSDQAQDGLVTSAAPIRRLRYCTGVNSWTDYSSDWAHRPYPSNVRVEQDFFWAAMISNAHDVIGYFSVGKVDSWSVCYEEPNGMQHIRTLQIDFVNSLDKHPDRTTHQQVCLDAKHPTYEGTFYVGKFDSLEAFWQKAADVLDVAFLSPGRCSGFAGETLSIPVISPKANKHLVTVSLRSEKEQKGTETLEIKESVLKLPLKGKSGRTVLTLSAGGKTTESRIWTQTDWTESLRVAAYHAADCKIACAYNYESTLGLITVCLGAAYLKDDHLRQRAREILEQMYVVHYDQSTGRHRFDHHRIQNNGGLLDAVRIYQQCFQSTEFLEPTRLASRQLLSTQRTDGNFYRHFHLYNNVGHPVKSLFDWGQHIRSLGLTEEADEIHAAVERAYRSIAKSGDDTLTEGSAHYEDGMTSCAGYQIASLWAQYGKRPEDLAKALQIFSRRRMLKPRVPDSRYFASTLRHWEGYWAMGLGQCMLGGHGWNSWSASFEHALFMATGCWDYLVECYATLSNVLQSIDPENGEFYFGFTVDPCWRDYYGLGSQHAGECYLKVPEVITVSCEAHQVFLTLSGSFYEQTYLRLGPQGLEILNGRILEASAQIVNIVSYAPTLKEVVITREGHTGVAIPEIRVDGRPVSVRLVGGE